MPHEIIVKFVQARGTNLKVKREYLRVFNHDKAKCVWLHTNASYGCQLTTSYK